jgi:hypothetical protein
MLGTPILENIIWDVTFQCSHHPNPRAFFGSSFGILRPGMDQKTQQIVLEERGAQ